MIHLRAKRVVVATGAYEAPLTFENNDLPGVMLSTAVQRLIHLHGIKPGNRAVIVASGAQGDEVAADLRDAGVEVVATVRSAAGHFGRRLLACHGGCARSDGEFTCDLVVMCGHRVPDAGLLTAGRRQACSGTTSAERSCPVDLPANVTRGGRRDGRDGWRAPRRSRRRIFRTTSVRLSVSALTSPPPDLRDGVSEGFDHIETLKRYTTTTMGPCQGRMCQLAGIGSLRARDRPQHGRDRRHHFAAAKSFGVLSARWPDRAIIPCAARRCITQHEESGAVWMDMGEWKRPRYYKTASCPDERDCVEEEYRAVRERAGLIDVSTLGKLDVKGRDAGKLLDKVYTNRFSDLKPGRVRYSVLCDEAGIMLDDGTISRLAEDHYFITTTTGNLDFVQQWLEWWLVGTGWDVHITNLTGGARGGESGRSKSARGAATLTACDLSTKAFPYMACREAEVAEVPALLMRIGFVGETGWEIHFPAECGEYLWNKLLEAGKTFGIRPFGMEAQRLLRLEKRHVIVGVDTDALTNPYEAGMAWVAKLDKADFIGRNALSRLSEAAPAAEPGGLRDESRMRCRRTALRSW